MEGPNLFDDGHPQNGGDVARGMVQLHDKSGRTVQMDIRATTTGNIVTAVRGGSNGKSYVLGQMNVAMWNEVLADLHDDL